MSALHELPGVASSRYVPFVLVANRDPFSQPHRVDGRGRTLASRARDGSGADARVERAKFFRVRNKSERPERRKRSSPSTVRGMSVEGTDPRFLLLLASTSRAGFIVRLQRSKPAHGSRGDDF